MINKLNKWLLGRHESQDFSQEIGKTCPTGDYQTDIRLCLTRSAVLSVFLKHQHLIVSDWAVIGIVT